MDAELTFNGTRACAPRSSGTASTPRSSAAPSTPGFEGAVTYLSGFQIVHRYAYVVLPVDGDPAIVFPTEARYVGEHGDSQIAEQVFVDRPGDWLADTLRGKRVGVYGMDYVMTVRDYAPLAAAADLVNWDAGYDLARAVKSDAELESVSESVAINVAGFHAFREAWAPGKTAAEVLAPAEEVFVARGCGRLTMNMVLVGAEFAIARDDTVFGEFTVPSLEIAGPGGHWVEVSRALGTPSAEVQRMLEAYEEYYEVAQTALRAGRDRARRPPRGVEGLHRARLPPRPRHGPLDRDDDDRAPAPRRGHRHRARVEHGLLDAPARDLGGRARVPLHAGHVARDGGRRRAARRSGDADLLSRLESRRCP